MVLIAMTIMSGMMAAGHAEALNAQKSPPVPVTFGIRALSPETPVDPQTAFVSQSIRLPDAVCSACTDQDRWTRTWTLSQMTLDRDNTRRDQVPVSQWAEGDWRQCEGGSESGAPPERGGQATEK